MLLARADIPAVQGTQQGGGLRETVVVRSLPGRLWPQCGPVPNAGSDLSGCRPSGLSIGRLCPEDRSQPAEVLSC
jgi:hypothetical protein